jgi:hypothetical protein
MERFDQITIYEIKFPIHSLGLDRLSADYSFGFGIAVNDGDSESDGQHGQKGWSGWGPYVIVFGKQTENAG